MKPYSLSIASLFAMILLSLSHPVRAQFFTAEIKACITTGELTAAADLLSLYIRQNPDSLNAYLLFARVNMGIGGPNPHTAAEKALREAIRRFPENRRVLKMLIEVKKRQDMPLLAEDWMAKAIKADPDDADLLAELLDSYLFTEKKKEAHKLRPLVESAIESAPDKTINYVSLAKLELSRDSLDAAIAVLDRAKEFDPINPALFKPLSEAYLKKGLGNECTDYYYQWLGLEDSYDVLEKEFEIAALTMPNETADAFKKLPWYEKKRFLLRYWRDQDPYPVSLANERLIEHMRRIMYSRDAFRTIEGRHGFDDRGKVYIRWGQPEDRWARSIPGRLYFQNESWYYPYYGLYMSFDFVSYTGSYYHEVLTLLDAVKQGDKDSLAKGLYAGRAADGMYGIYAILGAEPLEAFRSHIKEVPFEKIALKRDKKPFYEIGLDYPEINFVTRMYQFRGDSGQTALEVDYGVPLDQMNLKVPDLSQHTFSFQTDFVLLDSLRMLSLQAHNEEKYVYLPDRDLYMHYVGTARHDINPDDYKLTLQIMERSKNVGGYAVREMNVRDFTRDTLMLSDLKFSRKAEERGIEERTRKELIETEPYPFFFIKKSEPVFLYFEIYNLMLNPNERSDYRVSLLVERRRTTGEYFALPISSIGSLFSEGKPRRIETIYSRQGDSQTGVECIKLDIAGLESGYSRLTVTVEDLTGGDKAQGSIEFDLVE